MYSSETLDLRWRANDDGGFDCLDGRTKVGHIAQVPEGLPMHPHWQWFVGFVYREDGHRYRLSRREAMLAVEHAVEWQHATYSTARGMAPYPVKR